MTKNISNQQAKHLIKMGAKIVDIRDAKDFGVSHIPGALNISINELDNISFNRDTPIIVICYGGIRSIAAAERLTELGYMRVYNLKDGYDNYR